MKNQLKYLAISYLCMAVGMAYAQTQIADPLGKIDQGINDGMKNTAEMNRILDDQDKKTSPIRPYFNKALADAQDAILANKLDKAKKPIDKLHEIPNLNIAEQARLHLIDSWYFGRLGDLPNENDALIKLMPIGAGVIESQAFVDAGIRLLKRQYNGKDYGGAITTLGYLRKDPNSAIELGTLAMAIKKLDDLAEGTQNIIQNVKANEQGEWSTTLLRPSFYLESIVGSVASVDFTCESKTTNLPYTPDSMMATPSAWGACSIKINSTPGATYNLVQLINKP